MNFWIGVVGVAVASVIVYVALSINGVTPWAGEGQDDHGHDDHAHH